MADCSKISIPAPNPASSPSPAPSDDAYLGSDEHDIDDTEDGIDNDNDNPALLGDITDEFDDDYSLHPPARLIRAEAVLAHRTSRILLVLEHMVDSLNHQAVLRTAEAFGVQNVWLVDSGMRKSYTLPGGVKVVPTVTVGSSKWLTLRAFERTEECIEALKQDGREIWSTYLGPAAIPLTKQVSTHHTSSHRAGTAYIRREAVYRIRQSNSLTAVWCSLCVQHVPDLPARLAIVMGRELDGVSPAFLAASTRLVFLPMYGYTESFNVSVATALTLQRLFDICPAARGSMDDNERRDIRRLWYGQLACRLERRDEFMRWVERGERGELVWKDEDLRPKEAGRLPRISRSQRRRVRQSGEREIIIAPGQAPQDLATSVATASPTTSQPPLAATATEASVENR